MKKAYLKKNRKSASLSFLFLHHHHHVDLADRSGSPSCQLRGSEHGRGAMGEEELNLEAAAGVTWLVSQEKTRGIRARNPRIL